MNIKSIKTKIIFWFLAFLLFSSKGNAQCITGSEIINPIVSHQEQNGAAIIEILFNIVGEFDQSSVEPHFNITLNTYFCNGQKNTLQISEYVPAFCTEGILLKAAIYTNPCQNQLIEGKLNIEVINGNCPDPNYTATHDIKFLPPNYNLGVIYASEQIQSTKPIKLSFLNNLSPKGVNYVWQRYDTYSKQWISFDGGPNDYYNLSSIQQPTSFRCEVFLPTGSLVKSYYTNFVDISVPLSPGTIGRNQVIIKNTSPSLFHSVQSSSGHIFQWQKGVPYLLVDPQMAYNISWTDIAGATAETYQSPKLETISYFRRKASDGTNEAYSNIITVRILEPGKICENQTIKAGDKPQLLTNCLSPANAGTYQWQQSVDNINWSNIAGATALTYQPGIINKTTYFRRKASNGTNAAYSNTITIKIIEPGEICTNQTIDMGSKPHLLTNCQSPVNANKYQWQQSADGINWHNITGATALTYQPGIINKTTYFRRKAISSIPYVECYSNIITIHVNIPINPSNENYIITSTPYIGGENLNLLDKKSSIVSINYYDGLGRLSQEVTTGASENRKDIVRSIFYNEYGVEEKIYLPYENENSSESGHFIPNSQVITQQKSFYTSHYNSTEANYAYTQTKYENSPLNRIIEQSIPGNEFQIGSTHTTKINYTTNTVGTIKLYIVINDVLQQKATYPANELFATETTDADGLTTIEYKDKTGKLIEIWQKPKSGQSLITSYVYDDINRLRVVIPPKAQVETINSTTFNALVYRYKYDDAGRMIEKQIPGTNGPEYFVYDNRDRLVMHQDNNMRINKKWKVTLYDKLNRPVAEGFIISTLNHTDLITKYRSVHINQTRSGEVYTLNTITGITALNSNTVYTYYFYDDYKWVPSAFGATDVNPPASMAVAKGQLTGTKHKALDGTHETTSAKWLYSVTRYDAKYRPVHIRQSLYDGTATSFKYMYFYYAFDGNIERMLERQKFNTEYNTIILFYEYDQMRRPAIIHQQRNSQPKTLIAHTTYDFRGQPKTKTLGNNEVVNYAYDIRNWLTEIKSPAFEMQLYYHTSPTGIANTKLWNGNITAATWKQNGGAQQNYRYTYDGFSRITAGLHNSGYNESGITYDANGNINTLTRAGGTNAAAYKYAYDGNKLKTLTKGTTNYTYAYDANGNTITDGLRGFTITYNHLNLPQTITKGSDKLEYIYDAAGNKLAKKKNGAFIQFYAGSMVYNGNKQLEYIIHPEGLAVNNGSGNFDYQYNLTDHLGNVRTVLSANRTTLQTNNYYPFGLTHTTIANVNKNKYLYNGKEYQNDVLNGTEFGLLDYGARFYDPIIARFHISDRFSEKYSNLSNYQYAANNPIINIDVNGDSIWVVTKSEIRNDRIYIKEKVLYKDEQLYNKDGSLYSGNNSFAKEILETLNSLSQINDEFVREVVSTLKNSEKNHTIFEQDKGNNSSVYSHNNSGAHRGVKTGTSIKIRLGDKSLNDKTPSNSLTTMAHEFRHAYDYDQGLMKEQVNGINSNKTPHEIRAVNFENRVRHQRKIKLRTTYGGQPIDKSQLQNPAKPYKK